MFCALFWLDGGLLDVVQLLRCTIHIQFLRMMKKMMVDKMIQSEHTIEDLAHENA